MMEVHNSAAPSSGPASAERAEAYVQQLHGHLLLATIEKSR